MAFIERKNRKGKRTISASHNNRKKSGAKKHKGVQQQKAVPAPTPEPNAPTA